MDHGIELLAFLYELSLTNIKHHATEDIAGNFVRKFLARKSIEYGAVWMTEADDGSKRSLSNIYAMPAVREAVTVKKKDFDQAFAEKNHIIREASLFREVDLDGRYAYFKLGEFGILEFYESPDKEQVFSTDYFIPFLDVITQLGMSLESSYSYEKLQTEIWQRNAAERSLKANEEKYRRIIDNIDLGLLEVDNDDIIQHANKPFLELAGYELHEIMGKNASTLLLVSTDPDEETEEESPSGSREVSITNKEGEKKWVIVSGAPNYDQRGELIGSIRIYLDVSEEKEMRKKYVFKETQLQKLFEKSLDALVSIDSRGRVFEWSPQAEEIFGFERKDILGRHLSETIMPTNYREAHNAGMKKYMETGKGAVLNNRIEITALRKNGEEFPIELTIFPLRYGDDHYFTAFIRDITELRASKENMMNALQRQKELNNMKSQFISMTSHELRTPLTTIKSNTELIHYQLENLQELKRDKLQKNIARIDNNVERLDQLINNILMIGQLDSQKVPFNPQTIDVVDFIKDKILPDFNSRNQDILFEVKGAAYAMSLDKKLFNHIIVNLVENAIKYSPNGKSPEILLEFEEDQLVAHVKDYGMGIPKEDQVKLFDTFFRASNVGNIQGTGLGLAIVNEFIKIHGGEIKVESEVNKGSIFSILLPKN